MHRSGRCRSWRKILASLHAISCLSFCTSLLVIKNSLLTSFSAGGTPYQAHPPYLLRSHLIINPSSLVLTLIFKRLTSWQLDWALIFGYY